VRQGDLDQDVTIFRKRCTGSSPEFAVSVSIDAIIGDDEGLRIDWTFYSSGPSDGVFQPIVDCGWWTPAFIEESDPFGDDDGAPSRIVGVDCFRDGGPPRQIVTVRGGVVIPSGRPHDTLEPYFEAATLSQDASDSDSSSCPD
jgi:hypothetical protein